MSITLRQLEIFIAVAETAQVTKASKKLFVTQSAVSMALAELENQLGGSLFDRHGRSLLLNARGRYLLPLAKDITAQVANVETIMSERNDKLSGHIEIIASLSLGNYILPYLIGAFKRIHPKVHVNMLVYNTQYAERMVVDGSMDFVGCRIAQRARYSTYLQYPVQAEGHAWQNRLVWTSRSYATCCLHLVGFR